MITTREVTYDVDGLTMVGHLARPEGLGKGPWPAVLVSHDGVGLNDYQRSYADRLAEQGYVALAMDYHGGRWFSDLDELLARVLPLIANPERMRAIGHAALTLLLAEPGTTPDRVGAVGFGAGGSIVLELARAEAPFRCLGVVHPGLPDARPEAWNAVAGTVLLATGSEDPLCTPEQVMEFAGVLQQAGVDWRVNIYGGAKHGFWHPPVKLDGTLSDAAEHENSGLGHAGYHQLHGERVWTDIADLFTEGLAVAT